MNIFISSQFFSFFSNFIIKIYQSFYFPERNTTKPKDLRRFTSWSFRRLRTSPISAELGRIQRRLDGFDWHESNVWSFLCWIFGSTLSQDELISIAGLVVVPLKIKLDRNAKRRKAVRIKWFEENWTEIQPMLWYIQLSYWVNDYSFTRIEMIVNGNRDA
jgi:hypothetical protein